MSVEKYRCDVDKKGQQSIVDTAIDTFIRKYRRYRYRYIKSIIDNIDIDINNPDFNDRNKNTKFRLPLKLLLLRGSRPKSARASPQQCT